VLSLDDLLSSGNIDEERLKPRLFISAVLSFFGSMRRLGRRRRPAVGTSARSFELTLSFGAALSGRRSGCLRVHVDSFRLRVVDAEVLVTNCLWSGNAKKIAEPIGQALIFEPDPVVRDLIDFRLLDRNRVLALLRPAETSTDAL